jgi:type II secretory pathway component PulJ
MGVSAIVLAAIGGVFFSAIRLRDRTSALLDQALPLEHAVTLLRRDLLGAMPPGGAMAGDFRLLSAGGLSQSSSLTFSTTTGTISDNAPWADIQEVTWELREPALGRRAAGSELVRRISRNLLSPTDVLPDEERILGNVENLEFSFYDSSGWRDNWDTVLTDTNLPSAVRVRFQLVANENSGGGAMREPFELIVPLVSQSRTNTIASTEEAGTQ